MKSSKIIILKLLSIILISISCLPALASSPYIPEPLKPWEEWVLQDWQDRKCITCVDGKTIICNWPGPLSLNLEKHGGNFNQTWNINKAGWIPLPGDRKYPPQKVLVNKKPALVLSKKDKFGVYIKTTGDCQIQGQFSWTTLPQSIQIAENTSIINPLIINKTSHSVNRSGNTLWLQSLSSNDSPEASNKVFTKIYRKITDSVPMMITTKIDINISGTAREILLDWQMPEQEIPISIKSSLNVKMDEHRRIHVKAVPGKYTITCLSRLQGTKGLVISIKRKKEAPGPDTEYWSFEAQNQVRVVQITGNAATVDPGQTSIPSNWKRFPTYLVKKGQYINFETLKRGMNNHAPNDLNITRKLCLDQNGKGMTIQDIIQGKIVGKPRLFIQKPAKLGRMVIEGKDQLITKTSPQAQPGVEVRKGQIFAEAVSRIEDTRTFPAAGWGQTINKLSANLNLPPGWTLLHARGVDSANTWISSWTLMDCFLVLVISIACLRLLGIIPALLAMTALGLCTHDPEAPIFIWLWIIICLALIKIVPPSRLKRILIYAKYLLIITAIVIALPYGIQELQTGFFPQLKAEHVNKINDMDRKMLTEQAPQAYMSKSMPVQSMKLSRGILKETKKAGLIQEEIRQQLDVTGMVQAGPGLPETNWKQIHLSWNGPVEADRMLTILLISPTINLLLAFIKVAAIFGLIAFMTLFKKEKTATNHKNNTIKTATIMIFAILLLPVFFMPPHAQADNFPNKDLLNTLKKRLTKPAPCFPECADFTSMQANWKDHTIKLVISASCASDTAVPLPFAENIFWQKVHIDKNTSSQPVSLKNNTLWLRLNPGQHTITMTGQTNKANIQMHLPLVPHIVSCNGNGQWQMKGTNTDGIPGKQLQFIRQERDKNNKDFFENSVLPPLIRIHRILKLGLQWTITTEIKRISPPGSAIFLSIPLIQGESLVDGRYQLKDNSVQISLAPYEKIRKWTSVLKTQNSLLLKAPENKTWYETWEIHTSPIWHTEFEGIAPIQGFNKRNEFCPVWYPWPGEQIQINITRPEAIKGDTKVIESTHLIIEPGSASTKSSLTFSLRSTLGGQHKILLPQNAQILSIMLDGKPQQQGENNQIIFPLHPGISHIETIWKTKKGITSLYTTPKIDLGVSGVNSHTEIRTTNRWIWFVKGPIQGPAILFFGEGLFIILASIILGRLKFSPLNSFQWIIFGLGISQSGLVPGIIIIAWFALLWFRKEKCTNMRPAMFNLMQIILIIATIAATGALFFAIQNGLLGNPDMMICGNDSTNSVLRWYQDRIPDGILPQPCVFSLPINVYRIIMLLWALYLAFSLIKWTGWAWKSYSKEKLWAKININWKLPGKKHKQETNNK